MNAKRLVFLMFLLLAGFSMALAGSSPTPKPAPPPPVSSFVIKQGYPAPPSLNPTWECDSAYKKGDCNRNGKLTLEDVTRLVNAVYLNAESVYCPPCVADMNCDRMLTGLDAVWFIRFFFASGRAPLNCP